MWVCRCYCKLFRLLRAVFVDTFYSRVCCCELCSVTSALTILLQQQILQQHAKDCLNTQCINRMFLHHSLSGSFIKRHSLYPLGITHFTVILFVGVIINCQGARVSALLLFYRDSGSDIVQQDNVPTHFAHLSIELLQRESCVSGHGL